MGPPGKSAAGCATLYAVLIAVALALPACTLVEINIASTATPVLVTQAAATSTSTLTPRPPTATPTRRPTATLVARSWAETNCLHWSQAGQYVGSETCVYGRVTGTHDSGNAFFVNFSDDRSAFYVVSFDYALFNVRQACLAFGGLIESYQGRPEIILRDPQQIVTCDGYSLPLCFDAPDTACIDLLNPTPIE